MTKLLSANFLRLWKSKAFIVSLILCAAFGGLDLVQEVVFQRAVSGGAEAAGHAVRLEGQFFQYSVLIGIVAGALIALFLGTEYSDGTIRNKIAVGHGRARVYLANLVTVYAAALMCAAGYMLACLAVGVPILGWFTEPAPLLLSALLGTVVMVAAFCAVFTFIAMNCAKKSTSVVLCLLGVFVALFAAMDLYSMLDAPELIQNYEMSVAGEIVQSPLEPNPVYLTGTKRAVCQLLFDLLPTGQAIQYTMLGFGNPLRLMGLSAAVAAVFTGAGVLLFRRKDLK